MTDHTARALIVALQAQMQVVTRFLSEQFPDEWGTPPADEPCDVCNNTGWDQTMLMMSNPPQQRRCPRGCTPPADVCPRCGGGGCAGKRSTGSPYCRCCPSCGGTGNQLHKDDR